MADVPPTDGENAALDWSGKTHYSIDLFVGQADGWVEVVDSDNKPVVRLSLAAAEDLAVSLDHHARRGRIAAGAGVGVTSDHAERFARNEFAIEMKPSDG